MTRNDCPPVADIEPAPDAEGGVDPLAEEPVEPVPLGVDPVVEPVPLAVEPVDPVPLAGEPVLAPPVAEPVLPVPDIEPVELPLMPEDAPAASSVPRTSTREFT